MLTLVDERLDREIRSFDLRFECEECAHFDRASGACSGGFPSAAHRRRARAPGDTLEFCKSFELGG